MLLLEYCLDKLTVADLTDRLKLLAEKPKLTRKADMVKFLCNELIPEKLEKYWQELDELDQAAVAEAIYNWNGDFKRAIFLAKYKNLPNLFLSRNTPLKQELLALFFSGNSLAHEIGEACKIFISAPAPYQLIKYSEQDIKIHVKNLLQKMDDPSDGSEQPELTILSTETTVMHDLQAVLGLVESGKLSVSEKTHIAGAATLKKITGLLLKGDYYSEQDDWELKNYPGGPITPIRAYAWPLLLQRSGLARRVGTKLQLTAKGKKVPMLPIEESISLLYQRWRDKGILDEFRRIDVIKGQAGKGRRMFSIVHRRMAIENALQACPENEWIAVDDFFTFMQAENFDFHVIFDFWRLYIQDRKYGILEYSSCPYEVIQGRYILVYLFEYLATLGMLDVAFLPPYNIRDDYQEMQCTEELYFFSRYDGLLFFRINPLGSYCLQRSQTYQAPKQDSSILLQTDNDLNITLLRSATPSEKVLLEQYLQARSEMSYYLDQDYLLQALEQGGDLNIFTQFLQDAAEQPLAQAVQEVLAMLAERCNAFSDAGSARLLNCASVALAKMLASDPNTGKYCFQGRDKILVIPERSSNAFHKAVKKMGYFVPKKSP